MNSPVRLSTAFTEMVKCDVPIIVAPMFLVSNVEMVVAGSEAGAVGAFPALNARPVEKLRDWLRKIRERTRKPFAVNLIVNKTNIYLPQQMDICLEERVPLIIASLGNPAELIRRAHEVGTRVFCDVINEEHARKAVDCGADGLIAVGSGAGGHPGHISPLVWIPYLKRKFNVPIVAAGGIADGAGMAAVFALGADAVQVGTRFIASAECPVTDAYKQAVVHSRPQDIVTTYKLDGVAASVIRTEYVRKMGTELNWLERKLQKSRRLRRALMALRTLRNLRTLEKAAQRPTWKQLWGAGQVAGLIDDIRPIAEIVARMVEEYARVRESLPPVLGGERTAIAGKGKSSTQVGN